MSVQDEVPKSRITLTYKTEVDGEPAAVDLPLRLMLVGDFSQGSSKDRQIDLDERAPRNLNGSNTADIMQDMGISLDLVVPNKISGRDSRNINFKLPFHALIPLSPPT